MRSTLLRRGRRLEVFTVLWNGLELDAFQTSICMVLSPILLAGLTLNALWGLWWADRAAGWPRCR